MNIKNSVGTLFLLIGVIFAQEKTFHLKIR